MERKEVLKTARGCGMQNPIARSVFVSHTLLKLTGRVTVEARRVSRTLCARAMVRRHSGSRVGGKTAALLFFPAPTRWPIRRPLSSFGAPFVYRTEPRVRRFASRCCSAVSTSVGSGPFAEAASEPRHGGAGGTVTQEGLACCGEPCRLEPAASVRRTKHPHVALHKILVRQEGRLL